VDIVLKNLSKSFGELRLFENLNAVFPDKSVSAVLGASGQGKTTLLRILVGLQSADGGSIEGMPEKVSVLFQDDRLFPQLTVEQNIFTLAAPCTKKEDIAAILEKLGISDALDRPVTKLSGGMARRAALARALLAESDLLIMDEPFRGLDAENRVATAKTILEYASDKTVILFAHERDEAEALNAEQIYNL